MIDQILSVFSKRHKKLSKLAFICTIGVVAFLTLLYNSSLHDDRRLKFESLRQSILGKTRHIMSFIFESSRSTDTQNKWIIVTSISPPTPQIRQLVKIPGWTLLVVADKKTPNNWTYENAVFLDTEKQSNLSYQILEHLPWNSYTRKMLGYLYAIQHGAQYIYDTDDDNAPNDPIQFNKDFDLKNVTRGLILDSTASLVVNPYAHFGQSSVWPRGFPLESIGQEYNSTYTACQMHSPLIQQGVVNGDPDVDAIFRLTRKKLHKPLNVQFDNSAPTLILPKSVLAPFNSQNTVFHYDAFWSLLLPVTVSFRVTDIWRGYWAQPLLWTIGGHLGFYPPGTTQIRNAHIYLRDFGEEVQLYKQAGELTKLLTEWKCQRSELYDCMLELTTLMVNRRMWGSLEIQLLVAWIADLKAVGYKPPPLLANSSICLRSKPKTLVVFHGVNKPEKSEEPMPRIQLCKFCNFKVSNTKSRSRNTSSIIFPSTLLVVTFNLPYYENIWLLDLIYRPHFPNIVYCGCLKDVRTLDALLTSEEFIQAKVTEFSFVHANVNGGVFAYECGLRAIDMKYKVSGGYLVLSDDVLLNFWNIGQFNPEEMWIPKRSIAYWNAATVNVDFPTSATRSPWWNTTFGLNATKRVLDTIYGRSQDKADLAQRQQFRTNRELYYGLNSSTARFSGGGGDIFNIPKSKEDLFYKFGWLLRKNGVFLEIAVPFLQTGLSPPDMLVQLPGIVLWKIQERANPFGNFSKSISFIHPVKPSEVIKLPKLRQEYCTKYVLSFFIYD